MALDPRRLLRLGGRDEVIGGDPTTPLNLDAIHVDYQPQLFSAEKGQSGLPTYDRSASTQWFALGALALVWVAGIVCLAAGGHSYANPSVVTVAAVTAPLPPGFVVVHDNSGIWALIVTALLTLCAEGTGFVHSVALRWNMFREGRLKWITTLRLLSTSRTNWSTGGLTNLLYFLTLGLAFTASSQIFVAGIFSPSFAVGQEASAGWLESYSLASGAGLMTLGVCLLVQAALTTWIYLASKANIRTWSSSPLTIVLACDSEHHQQPVTSGAQYASLESAAARLRSSSLPMSQPGPTPMIPGRQQESLVATRKRETLPVLGALAILIILIIVWAVIVLNAFLSAGTPIGGADLDGDSGKIQLLSNSGEWANAPAIRVFSWQLSGTSAPPPMSTSTTVFVCLLLVFAIQALLTFTLHCMELVCNAYRDQRAWEKAARHLRTGQGRGASLHPNVLLNFLGSFPNALLLACKILAHWLFNRCLLPILYFAERVDADDGTGDWQTSQTQINLFGIPTAILAAVMFVLLLVTWYLAVRRPSTAQPATYGHVATLTQLIDDWGSGDLLYWGDKGLAPEGGNRRAGTAGSPTLGPIQYEAYYI